MSSFRDKLQVYFLGLLTGLVLGGGFFVLKLDDYVSRLSKSLTEETDKTDATDDKVTTDKTDKPKPKAKTKKENYTASYSVDSTSGAALDGDTLAQDSAGGPPSVFGKNDDDEIVVKKDELVSQRSVPLVDLDGNAGKDSSLQKMSGIRDPQTKALQVEFWRSPLNYRGYKMSRSKLVLFGNEPGDEVALYKVDDEIYLKNHQGVYHLEFTGDFRQADKVNDAALLAKLK